MPWNVYLYRQYPIYDPKDILHGNILFKAQTLSFLIFLAIEREKWPGIFLKIVEFPFFQNSYTKSAIVLEKLFV